ncbi:MAG: malate synthase [Firmicutes bacterium]|nr:malate synthase [Bacillota bacterium]
MDLLNMQVTHKVFGTGKIIAYDDSYIQINFPSGIKRFVMPDAFGSFLTLVDEQAAQFVAKLVQQGKKEYEEEQRRRQQLKEKQKKKRMRFIRRERLARRRQTRRIHPSSQSVFWCTKKELESVFDNWNVFTGAIKSGLKKGQPRRLARVGQNSACLLTIRDSNMPEQNRYIQGVFMVNENFDGRKCEDGYIVAHSEHRLRLSKQEAKKMLFWNYYVNSRHPHRMTWNSGRHRYFNNIWMAQILRDIMSLKKKPTERKQVQQFFDYFCRLNRIRKDELPEPNGALLRT